MTPCASPMKILTSRSSTPTGLASRFLKLQKNGSTPNRLSGTFKRYLLQRRKATELLVSYRTVTIMRLLPIRNTGGISCLDISPVDFYSQKNVLRHKEKSIIGYKRASDRRFSPKGFTKRTSSNTKEIPPKKRLCPAKRYVSNETRART